MEDQQYTKLLESVNSLIQSIHRKIDDFQSECEEENQKDSLGQEISELRDDIALQIDQGKKDISKLESNAGYLQVRQTKLKTIKQQFQKEIKRFLDICISLESRLKQEKKSIIAENKAKSNQFDRNSQGQQLDQIQLNQIDLQNQLIAERTDEITHIDKEANKLNNLMNELAQEVNQQEEYLVIVDDHQMKTKDNIVNANVELDKAQGSQSAANKKYCLLAVIIFIALAVAVTIYFLTKNK